MLELVASGRVSEARIDQAVRRLLLVKFPLGLFDDPYVDEDDAERLVGAGGPRRRAPRAGAGGDRARNDDGRAAPARRRLFVDGVDADVAAQYGDVVTDPAQADVAVVRLQAPFEPRDDYFLEAFFHQGSLDFPADWSSGREAGRAGAGRARRDLDRPAVLTPLDGVVAGLTASFGASDAALLDALTGRIPPGGRLPFELPRSMDAVRASRPDVPSDTADPLYPYGSGLTNPGGTPAVTDPTVTVVRLRTDDDSGLVATANARPRLSWSLASERPGVLQAGYEVQVSADPGFADPTSSGEVDSDVVVDHDWPGAPLTSRQVAYWRVRVRTDQGWTAWSEAARVEAALLAGGDWTARPVFLPSDRGRDGVGPAPLLRREFELPAEPVSARLYVTALGVHRTSVNGRPVGDELLEPGWTSYRDRLLFATHDVTALLRAGRDVLAGRRRRLVPRQPRAGTAARLLRRRLRAARPARGHLRRRQHGHRRHRGAVAWRVRRRPRGRSLRRLRC